MAKGVRSTNEPEQYVDTVMEFDYGEIDIGITRMMDAEVARLHHEASIKRYLGQPHERSRLKRHF